MEIRVRSEGETTVLYLTGKLDLNGAAEVKNKVKELLGKKCRNLIFNLEKVEFINSSGLGALVSILKDVRISKGKMFLTNLSQYVKEIFEITQLQEIFDIYDTEKQVWEELTVKHKVR
jgi:anti-sigma B factor antagonist